MIKATSVEHRRLLKRFWHEIGRFVILFYMIGPCIWLIILRGVPPAFFLYVWAFASLGISIAGCFFIWGKKEPKREYEGDA